VSCDGQQQQLQAGVSVRAASWLLVTVGSEFSVSNNFSTYHKDLSTAFSPSFVAVCPFLIDVRLLSIAFCPFVHRILLQVHPSRGGPSGGLDKGQTRRGALCSAVLVP
jgi:hypothetical protein